MIERVCITGIFSRIIKHMRAEQNSTHSKDLSRYTTLETFIDLIFQS
jgi:hypothetical protein